MKGAKGLACAQCGSPLGESDRFCTACGAPCGAAPPAAEPVVNVGAAPYGEGAGPAPAACPGQPVLYGEAQAPSPVPGSDPTALPAPAPKGGRGRFFLGLLCGLLAASLVWGVLAGAGMFGVPGRAEGRGFASAEAAAAAYLDAFAAGDMDRILAAFAVETYVQSYDLAAYMARTRSYHATAPQRMPPAHGLAAGINLNSRRAAIAEGVLGQYQAVFTPDLDPTTPYLFESEGEDALEIEVERFAAKLAAGGHLDSLATLELTEFIGLEALDAGLYETYHSAAVQANREAQRAVYGAEALEGVIARVTIDGAQYLVFLETAQYNGRWYLLNFGGDAASLLGLHYALRGMLPLDGQENWL